ncbi:MAG: biotin--[acetyl-CoA-carboxylase] ligase [Deltaproteobacteria bacterium]|nr:biotin--[acetyl-CoA-carboxylase] ligase [Deltaproteobacteria bacterium]
MDAKEGAEPRIIRLLRSDGEAPVSGESLSTALGISRTAVWKHIERLRSMGYAISASTRKGYSLDTPPGALFNGVEIAAGLTTSFVGAEIHFYPAIASTNVKAFELGRSGAPEGAAVVADAQTNGRGRLGRRWESPPGVNLYTSIILRPAIQPRDAHQLTFVAAVATAECAAAFVTQRPVVKWPNDILINGRKAAGILLEMDSEPDRVNFVVMGIGVNVNMRPRALPAPIRETAAPLSGPGALIDRCALARALYSGVEKWYKIYLDKGFAAVMDAWRGLFDAEGRPVTVTAFNRVIKGICAGVDADGALLVRTSGGKVERVVSGDVETARQ